MNIDLTTTDIAAITGSLESMISRYEQYAADCEALPDDQRRLPTDNPETWRKRIVETFSTLEKVQHAASYAPINSNGQE